MWRERASIREGLTEEVTPEQGCEGLIGATGSMTVITTRMS